MTTIVGIRQKNGEFFLGADTQLSSPGAMLGNLHKIVQYADEKSNMTTLIGIAGSATAILAIQDLLDSDAYTFDSTINVYRSALAMHLSMREHHGLVIEEEFHTPFESMQCQMLIANKAGMWTVLSSREVIPVETFAAIGSGREFALGALEVLGVRDGHNYVTRALEISAKYDKDTGSKTTIWGSNNGKPSRI